MASPCFWEASRVRSVFAVSQFIMRMVWFMRPFRILVFSNFSIWVLAPMRARVSLMYWEFFM